MTPNARFTDDVPGLVCRDEEIDRRLFVADPPERADLAVVFGFHESEGAARRARQGVRLYQEGWVPRLLFTGGGHREPGSVSEAARMANLAVSAGVPEQAVLCEEVSRNTYENVERSLDLLEHHGLLETSKAFLLVSCPWHMGRCQRVMRRSLRERGRPDVRLLCCPQMEECTADNWRADSVCRMRVLGEFELVRELIDAGLLEREAN